MASISQTASLSSRLSVLLGVERGEKRTLILLVTLNFAVSVAFVLVQTTAFGLFVDEFGSASLPYAYLSVAVLASAVAYAYLQLSRRVSFQAAQYANLAFLVSGCLAFWGGLHSGLAHWFVFLLPFWFQALVNLANLIVWHSAGHLFNVRQAKRLFGLVGAGNWVANIIGGLVIATVLAVAGAANLYVVAAVALAAATLVLRPILKRVPSAITSPRGQEVAQASRQARPILSPFRLPYSRLIFAYTLLWWLAFCVIDNIFFDRAALEFTSAAQLASFLGRQLAVMGVIAIITTSLLTSRIVGRYGLRAGLLAMPLIVTACAALLVIGGALRWSAVSLFWIATVGKTLNVALGFSLSLAAGTLLYQPLLGDQRNATQTISEGIVQPVAFGVAGLLLLLFNTMLHFNAVGMSYLFLVIAALWLWVIGRLSQQYPQMLSEALRKRNLGESTTLLFDPAGVAQLEQGLRSPRAGVVLYALNQLEQLEPRAWQQAFGKALPALIAHPAPEVRLEALSRVLLLRMKEVIPLVRSRLGNEAAPRVYSLLIQVLASLGDAAAAPQIAEALASTSATVRYGAIVGMLHSSDPQLMARAGEVLLRMVGSADAEDRALAARVLADAGESESTELVSRLLSDREVSVRKAAILASARYEARQLLNRVVRACDDFETAPVAERILISKSATSVAAISDGLRPDGGQPVPRQRLQSLIHVLGQIQDTKALDLLRSCMDFADPGIRLRVFRSLSAHDFNAQPADRVFERINSEIKFSARLAGSIETLEDARGEPPVRILKEALETDFGEARSRVLLLLSFVYDARAILRAERALAEGSAHSFAFAAETVDALLPARLKPLVVPLLENTSCGRRVKQWRSAGLQIGAPALGDLISALIGTGSDSEHSVWARMCAIHAAGILGMSSCIPALESLSSELDPGLSQSSRWSLARIVSGNVAEGKGEMLSLVERVLILKSARLFSETPDNVLADIAGLAEEILVEKDQIVFNKGDAGDSLYIIVTGAVEVRDGDRLLNRLAEGDIFGELALLDPEPRLATVRASEPAQLLRLDESHFRVILAERPEVSSAIIRVITRYLRSLLRGAGDVDPNLSSSQSSRAPAAASSSAA